MSVNGLGATSPQAIFPVAQGKSGRERRDEDSFDPTFSAMLAGLTGPATRVAERPSPAAGETAGSRASQMDAVAEAGRTGQAAQNGQAGKAQAAAAAAALLAALTTEGTEGVQLSAEGAAFLAQLQAGMAAGETAGLQQLQTLLTAYDGKLPAELLALQTGQAQEADSAAAELLALLKASGIAQAGQAGSAELQAGVATQATGAPGAPEGAKVPAEAAASPDAGSADPAETGASLAAQATAGAARAEEQAAAAARVPQAGEAAARQAGPDPGPEESGEVRFEQPVAPAPPPQTVQSTAAPEAPLAQRLPNPVEPARLMEVIPRSLAESGPGQYSLTLQLHPAELGSVRLQLHLSGNQVQAVMEVTNVAARQSLEAQSDQLRQNLSQAGLALTGFTVSTGNSGGPPRQRQEQFAEMVGVQRASGRPGRQQPAPQVQPAEGRRPGPERTGSRLNTLV